jgi:hypothetical protein
VRWLSLLLVIVTMGCKTRLPTEASWRSSLYPEGWLPVDVEGVAGPDEAFLHDFSYAGYELGNRPIPVNPGRQILTVPQHFGDGRTDATSAIQAVIDRACEGGGVVQLPPGTYRVRPDERAYALILPCNRVLLRGSTDKQGNPTTYLFNDQPYMRNKTVIRIGPRGNKGSWADPSNERDSVYITQDLLQPTRHIPVEDASGFAVGEAILIRTDLSKAFRAEHGMSERWPGKSGLMYRRVIRAVDLEQNTLTLDTPTRYPLKTRDGARVSRLGGRVIQHLGVENLYMGMRENPKGGLDEKDYSDEGTAAYGVHSAHLIVMDWAEHLWVRNVRSYRPAGNTGDVHLLSNGIRATGSTRAVTVQGCRLANPQYRGGGGNGYLFFAQGQEGLWQGNRAGRGRHNFTLHNLHASGNVLLHNTSQDAKLVDDFHRMLSHANLLDNHTLIRVRFSANDRGAKSKGAGITSSQNVFWRTKGDAYQTQGEASDNFLIDSHQYGWGYIIGTFGQASAVKSSNFVEGVGQGDTLTPKSLYLDQKARRDKNPAY